MSPLLTLLVQPLAVAAAASSHRSSSSALQQPHLAVSLPAEHVVAVEHADVDTTAPTTQSQHRRSRRQQARPKEDRYEILPSSEILARMQALVDEYPAFATLTTTQEWFGLPRAGGESDCTFDTNYEVHGKGCNNYVLIIQDKEAYPDDPDVQLSSSSDDAVRYLDLEDGYFANEDGHAGERSGWKHVPDVFLSGAVHGNERVGPTSLLEMSELMVEAAHCESLPRMRYKPGATEGGGGGIGAQSATNPNATSSSGPSSEDDEAWEAELARSRTCRASLSERGATPPYRRWLARLVSTRRSIVIPTANALGYSRDEREEDGIDPNRDFPFDIERKHSDRCMQTIAGRSINELFRSHLFPIGLTFHGGMEVIAYEWGAPTYLNKDSPDAVAQRTIGSAYSRYANGFAGHVPYDYGTMNDKVYYVRGGMEDWAFAGSWDPDRVVRCTPNTFGGYPEEKTEYGNSTLRAFNMLIETSSPKTPARKDLGKRTAPFVSTDGEENGHIARNMRLALLAVDVVEPYVSIRGVEGLEFEDDIVPGVNLRRYDGTSYFENGRIVWVPAAGDAGRGTRRKAKDSQNRNEIKVSWTVGGSFDIDATELIVGTWDALPTNLANANDGAYPSHETMDSIDKFTVLRPSNIDGKGDGSIEGRSRWHEDGPHPTKSSSGDIVINPTFEATIDASAYSQGTNLAIFARAKVDKKWLTPASDNVGPNGMGPVSHIVNARGNPSYLAANAGKEIRGRRDDWWYSDPMTVVVGVKYGSEDEVQDQFVKEEISEDTPMSYTGDEIRAVHLNARLGYLPGLMSTVARTGNDNGNPSFAPTEQSMPWLLGTLSIAIVVILLAVLVRRRQLQKRRFMEHVEEAEDGLSLGSSYRDDPDGDDAEMTGVAA